MPSAIRAAPPSNLPARPTSLVGRAQELADLRKQLLREDVRLLTLVGPPGVGKTRLAVEVADTAAEGFADGVLFVDLTPIRDPALVIYAVAQTLDLREGTPGVDLPVVDRVKDALRDHDLLLLLDNFEHVVEGAPAVGELLGACPRLKVLATSRVPLHLLWEQQFPLSPLALPDLSALPDREALAQIPAVAMFVARARTVAPDFTLTDQNARAVAEICVRLDGLPLAIELVVARVKMLPLSAIIDQLGRRLEFLTGGPRDLPARQRTLRSAIAWSYELLTSGEQSLFRRLAVFAGGCDLEAVHTVCASPGDSFETIDALSALVDRNLLLLRDLPEGRPRYGMLESLREFALEQLLASGEAEEFRRRHAAHFLGLVEEAEPQLMGPEEDRWHVRLEREHDNLRLVLGWALDGGDPEVAVRMAGALRRFWNVRGHWSEGRGWLERALANTAAVSSAARAKALYAGAVLVHQGVGNAEAATRMTEECLRLRRALGDKAGAAEAIWYLGHLAAEPTRQMHLYEECLALAREIGNKTWMGAALGSLASVIRKQGDTARAKPLLQEALVWNREAGEYRGATTTLFELGSIALEEGDSGQAQAMFVEALAAARNHGDKSTIIDGLERLAEVAWRQGDSARAGTLLNDALTLSRELGAEGNVALFTRRLGRLALRDRNLKHAALLIEEGLRLNRAHDSRLGIARNLEAAAELVAQAERFEEAARWLATATRLREATGLPPLRLEESQLDRPLPDLERVRAFADAWASGAAAVVEEVVEEALGVLRSMAGRVVTEARQKGAGPLSRREEEVAGLVARGLPNREIAKLLFISERTVDSHVEHILTKLGFASRAQIAAWAVRQGVDSTQN